MVSRLCIDFMFVLALNEYVSIMNLAFVLGLLIAFVEYLCLKQLDFNKRFHHNLVNTFSVYTMDHPGGNVKKYSARELLKYRSMPRQWILPVQQLLARLKGMGILNFRSYRSETKTTKSNKPQKKQLGVNISNLVYPK